MLKKYRASILGSAIASALFSTCTIPAFAANIIVDSHQTVPGDFPSSWTIALGDQLLIGHSANGELTISSGANVYTPSPIQIGGAINGPTYGTGVVGTGTGTLNVQGVGTILTSKGDFTVGKTATGSLTVTARL